MSTPTRKLSLHERYSVMRRNVGFTHPLTALLTYPSAALPLVDFLSQRILELQQHFPLLRSTVVNARTRAPLFQQRPAIYAAEDILRHEVFDTMADGTEEKKRVLYNESNRMAAEDDTRPRWQVTIFDSSPPGDKSYLALSVDHVLLDGMGLILLTQALLAPDVSSLPTESLGKIPLYEDTVDLRPPYSYLLPIVWQELVVGKLPSFLQQYVRQPKTWFGSSTQRPPLECDWDLALVELQASLVTSVKATGKSFGVQTLHPLLKTAYFAAMWAVFAQRSERAPFVLHANTPRSERAAVLGHAYCTSNYASSIDVERAVCGGDDFRETARAIAAVLASPRGVQQGRWAIGMLALIPDPVSDPARAGTDRPTGWEDYFLDKAGSASPFGGSLGLSNLGYARLPGGAKDLVWTQAAWPCAAVLSANAVGHEGGLRVTTVWREGAAASKNEVDAVQEVFARVLGRVADAGWQKWTLAELTAA
ncbi:hypothetical protein HDZ31DRAFT_83557 [Schizophyllum fasciatum]